MLLLPWRPWRQKCSNSICRLFPFHTYVPSSNGQDMKVRLSACTQLPFQCIDVCADITYILASTFVHPLCSAVPRQATEAKVQLHCSHLCPAPSCPCHACQWCLYTNGIAVRKCAAVGEQLWHNVAKTNMMKGNAVTIKTNSNMADGNCKKQGPRPHSQWWTQDKTLPWNKHNLMQACWTVFSVGFHCLF